MKQFKKLLDKFPDEWYNKVCWRCGKRFYHGFSKLCKKCDMEIRNDSKSEKITEINDVS